MKNIEWNTVKYIDCMDEKEGLPSLPDKSIDLCFTDPPYNKKYKGKKGFGIIYKDNRSDYMKWCCSWFNELKRICKRIIIHCGFPNLNMWIKYIEEPNGIIYHYKPDVQAISSIAYLDRLTPNICYGKGIRINENPIKAKNYKDKRRGRLIHPCPMNYIFLMKLLEQIKPLNVLDPFMGSGTTAYCCKLLGINYFGYEKEILYKNIYLDSIKSTSISDFL